MHEWALNWFIANIKKDINELTLQVLVVNQRIRLGRIFTLDIWVKIWTLHCKTGAPQRKIAPLDPYFHHWSWILHKVVSLSECYPTDRPVVICRDPVRSHTPWLSFISFRPLNGTHKPQKSVCHPRIAQSSPEGFMRYLCSDLSLTPGVSVMLYDPWNRPRTCWCFESWHCFSSASVLSPLPSKGWAVWGWWPVTEREEIWLSTLSGCQLEWRTMEQVTPLGRLVPGPPFHLFSLPVILSQQQRLVYTQGIK